MNTYEMKDTVRMQATVGERTVLTELGQEFTLPDYQPEIKRLIRVKATVLPADKYVGGLSAECTGTVDYQILYTGNDGALYSTTQSGEYRFSVPTELPSDVELGEGIVCDVTSVAEQMTGRVQAPRRLSVKCRLRSRIRFYATRAIGGVADGEDLERLYGESVCVRRFLGTGEAVALADEILCDANDRAMRVICAEGQVFLTEVTAGSGCVNCRGELCLKLLCCHDDAPTEPPYTVTRRIPFTQSVPVDGAEVNCEASARGTCTELRVTVEEGRILCEASAVLEARAMRNERIAYVRDLYSTKRACETAHAQVVLPQMIRCANGNFSLNTAIPLEEVGIRAGLSVADLSGTVTVGETEVERGKYYLSGKCRFHAVLCGDGEFSAHELEVPFRYEMEGGDAIPADTDAAVDLISCRARVDGERIGLDAELAVSVALTADAQVALLTEAAFGSETERRHSAFTVCFPSREDTLWSVAKRYRIPVASLLARNDLAEAPAADSADSLANVHFLLV